jgi:hypothetical protein
MGKKSRSESGVIIPDHISESFETIFWVKILKFFDADPGSGIFLALDPGWEKYGSGINIPDPQHCCYGGGGEGHHIKNAAEHTSTPTLQDTSVEFYVSLIHFLWEQASSTAATPVGTEKRKKKDSPSSALPVILNGKASSEGPAGKKYSLDGQEEQSGGGGGEEEGDEGEAGLRQLGSTGIDQTAPICTKVGCSCDTWQC